MPPTKRILIVDPQPEVAAVLTGALSADGYEAIWVCDYADAFQHLDRSALAIGLIEVMLPDRPGIELADEFARRGIPLILMTGHPSGMELLDQHSYPHLHKPFRLETLRGLVEDIVAEPIGA